MDSLLSHLEEDLGALRAPSTGNLGLADTILWLVKEGMHWSDLLPTFQYAMLFNSKPVLIVINVGGNNLVTIKQAKFIRVINRDLKYMQSVFPMVKFVWSDILPRTYWIGIANTQKNLKVMNDKRRRINRAGRQAVRGLSHGRAIIHELDPTTPGLFKNDGTHLTLIGNAIFLNTFKEALKIFLTDNTQMVYDADL